MRTIWRNAIRLKGVSRHAWRVVAGLSLAAPAFAQGDSPSEKRTQCSATSVYQHDLRVDNFLSQSSSLG